jgi:hypothetical protein
MGKTVNTVNQETEISLGLPGKIQVITLQVLCYTIKAPVANRILYIE